MAFSGATQIGGTTAGAHNFREDWSTETTIEFLQSLELTRRLNGRYDGSAESSDIVFVQNPNYAAIEAQYGVDSKAGSATNLVKRAKWGDGDQASASRIQIPIEHNLRSEYDLFVEDELVNAVRDYRTRYQAWALNAMGVKWEAEIVKYFDGLATSGAATVNGNAGPIETLDFPGDKDTGFNPTTGKPQGNATQQAAAREWIDSAFQDAAVTLFRANQPIDSGNGIEAIGGMGGNAFALLPVELFVFGLSAYLENKGLSIDMTRQIIQRLRVGGAAAIGAGEHRGIEIIVTNSIAKPADKDGTWNMYFSNDTAVAAPMRRMRNYVTPPEANDAEKFTFRHVTNAGLQIINAGASFIKVTMNAADGS